LNEEGHTKVCSFEQTVADDPARLSENLMGAAFCSAKTA